MSKKKPRLLSGVLFIAASVFIVVSGGGQTTLKCNRLETNPAVECELMYSGLFGKRITPIQRGQLQGAIVKRKRSTYRVVLLTKQAQIPLTPSYSLSKQGKQKKVDRIEAFLNTPERVSLTIQQNNNWFAYSWALLFALGGGYEIYDENTHKTSATKK